MVDLNTFTKKLDINVGLNPTKIAATGNGDLFTIVKGNYADIPAEFVKLSSVTDKKISSDKVGLEYLNITGTKGFVIGDYSDSNVKTFDILSGTINGNFVADQTIIKTPYGVTINTLNNDVYVGDANGYADTGKFFCFGADGKLKFDFATGALPQCAVFNYNYK